MYWIRVYKVDWKKVNKGLGWLEISLFKVYIFVYFI